MKIGLFVHKIQQFEPDTGENTQGHCEAVSCFFSSSQASDMQ